VLIDLSIKLVGRGWAEATISDGEIETKIISSYLSDGLKELILSFTIIFEGAINTSFSWQNEPGEFQWFLSIESDYISIKIIIHEKNFNLKNINKGKVIFESKEKMNRIGHRILNEFEKLRLEFGEQGYKTCWTYDYPSKELNRLREAIKRI
jgi:hypothetical protein